MKLIDILVEELPKRGGWPEGVAVITQDSDKAINNYKTADGLKTNESGTWKFSSAWEGYLLRHSDALFLASDYATAIITREQYEAALAAKNDGWIEWGGGERPVSDNTMVDVRYRDGQMQKAERADSYEWGHGYAHFVTTGADIIAYRLHQPQEVSQTEAEQEADLNDCIGQSPATEWNGEGLPPAGCECERSWAGDKWLQCKIIFTGDEIVLVKLETREVAYQLSDVRFRPVRSEAERKREKAVQALCNAGGGNGRVDENSGYGSCWFDVFDAIAAGKIPGVKLED